MHGNELSMHDDELETKLLKLATRIYDTTINRMCIFTSHTRD